MVGESLTYIVIKIFVYCLEYRYLYVQVARCSSVVRAFAHGAMGCRIDPSWWTHSAISPSSQCTTTGVRKAVVCVILSVGTLAANRKE